MPGSPAWPSHAEGLLRITSVTLGKIDAPLAGLGALTGVLSGAIAIGIGQLLGGLTGPVGTPVVAVGQLAVDDTPSPIREFAIRHFGSHDKEVLVTGILVVLAIFAAGIGVLAMRKLWYGLAGIGLFAVVGVVAVSTRPTVRPADVLPTLAGAALAAVVMTVLVHAAAPAEAGGRSAGAATPPPGGGGAPPGRPATGMPRAVPGSGGKSGPPRPRPGGSGPPAGRPVTRRPASPPSRWPNRRRFIRVSAASAGVTAVGVVGGRLLAERSAVTAAQHSLKLPSAIRPARPVPAGANLGIPGLSTYITPNSRFYRVDTAIVLPEVPPASWHLRIHGMVQKEIHLNFDDLIRMPLIEDYVTLTCVSDPVEGPYISNALWRGVSLRALLRQAGIRAGASQLFCTSVDGFTSGSPVQTAMDGRDSMLAVAMNNKPLPVEHGFPVRMVVPGLYGYVSACKWITDIEVTTYQANVSYWAQRGWSAQAPIKTESRIDVPSGRSPIRPGRTAVAGVAWAQHKGIDAVEVRVDQGSWNQARLAAVAGIDTWRQWVWQWEATPGTHLIEARATDATGFTQTALQEPPVPNGATGYPAIQVQVQNS
jgi:DMSO/TMAO reductase YedYZ molybdopterin-dependent catalytic subunit